MTRTPPTMFAIGILLATGLSGCFADESAPSSTDGESPSSSTSGTEPGTNQTSENTPPEAALTSDVANGSIPFNVTFAVNATDADEDNLTWSLDANGDGTADANGTGTQISESVVFEFTEAGNFTANLTVTDGNASLIRNVTISAVAVKKFDPVTLQGTAKLPCPQCRQAGANTGVGYRGGQNELDSVFRDITAAMEGQPFVISSTGGDPDMVFRTSCASSGGAIGNAFTGAGGHTGVVPADARCVLMWENQAAQSTIKIVIG